MTDLDLHHEFDRLALGRSHEPDLSAIMAGGRRRRRRTRAVWTAAGLATAAVVTPLALLVGGGTTAPVSPGVTTAPGAVSSVEPVDGHGLEMTAAVAEALPTAELASQAVTNSRGTSGLYSGETTTAEGEWEAGWAQTYAVDGLQQLLLTTSTTTDSELGEERPWNPCPEDADDCTATQVGDRLVTVGDSFTGRGDGRWIRNVQVTPADGVDGALVDMSAFVYADSREEAEAKLPSVETLTDLALDERLAPPTE